MVRVRMMRMGKKNVPYFRIAVFDARTRRNGRTIENLGTYDPRAKEPGRKVVINRERLHFWRKQGAQLTERLERLLKHVEVV